MNKSSGNIFFLLFASIGVVGALAVGVQSYILGPLKTSSTLNTRSAVQEQMDISMRVARKNAIARQIPVGGDCDGDGMVEPIPYESNPSFRPAGGGLLPVVIAGAVKDPWNNRYGYCVWDHGINGATNANSGGTCAAQGSRLSGSTTNTWTSMAIVSAGANKKFETTCNAWADVNADLQPDVPLLQKGASSDDVYLDWTYNNSFSTSSEIWALDPGDTTTAEIAKNLSVKDGVGVEQLSFNASSAILSLTDATASGHFPTTLLNSMEAYNNALIETLSPITFPPEDLSGDSYQLRNQTGDSFNISNGTYNMLRIDSTNREVEFGLSANNYMRFSKPANRMRMKISGDRNVSLSTGYEFSNSQARWGYPISGLVQTGNGSGASMYAIWLDTPTTSALDVLGLSGLISFNTRALGNASGTLEGGALVPNLSILPGGQVRMGPYSNATESFIINGNFLVGGTLGVNTTTPLAELHMEAGGSLSGAMQLNTPGAEVCDSSIEGAFRIDYAFSDCFETCDGVSWKCVQQNICDNNTPIIGSVPNSLGAFRNNVNSAVSTLLTSDIVPFTNNSCANQMTIMGDGTPEYRICSDSACSSVLQTWSSNNYDWTPAQSAFIQLRNTSPASPEFTTTTTLKIGSSIQNWILRTQDACSGIGTQVGTICADGTVYIGISVDGYQPMYASICTAGKTWNGTACTGVSTTFKWSNLGTVNICDSARFYTGRSNTTWLAGLSNADAPYSAAQYCENLVQNGYSDWYLPSIGEASALSSRCQNLPGIGCNDIEMTTGLWNSYPGDTGHASCAPNANVVQRDNAGGQGVTKVSLRYIMCVRR